MPSLNRVKMSHSKQRVTILFTTNVVNCLYQARKVNGHESKMCKDTKRVISSRKWESRQYNGQNKNNTKETNNDPHHACVCSMYQFCLCFCKLRLVNCSDGGVFFVFPFILFLYLCLALIDQENVILVGKHDLLLFVFMRGVSLSCLALLHVNVICYLHASSCQMFRNKKTQTSNLVHTKMAGTH